MSRRSLGMQYERRASQHLTMLGAQVLEQNFTAPGGEIDMIIHMDGYLVFVEVKGRSSGHFGRAAESVTLSKQKRISTAACHYLSNNEFQDMPIRFDVVAIDGDELIHIKNAFDFVGLE